MTVITIDNQDYDIEVLSDEAKAQVASVQFCDVEILKLKDQIAVLQTARNVYARNLSFILLKHKEETNHFSMVK